MTREELWLAAIAGLEGAVPPDYPVWHYEDMLAAIYDAVTGAASPRAFPARSWHLDEFLYAVYCMAAGLDDPGCPEPTDRIELFWKGIYDGVKGEAGASVPTPVWRIEEFLKACFDASTGWGERTLTGSIVSFIGRANTEILSLTAAITPVQSFNGYDHPWPAGGGKNLLDVSTCTLGKYIGADGSIGTLEAAMYSALIPVVIGDSYTYSYNLTGEGSNTRIHGYDENGNWLQQIATGSSTGQITISFAIPDGVRYVRISTTKPEWTGAKDHQFEKGSTKTAYAPYENICPITGYTGANIYRDGGNLLDVSTCTPGYYISETGSISALSYAMYSALIPVEAGEDYVFSYTLLRSSSRTRIHGYDSSENWVSQLATAPNEVGEITASFTVPAGVSYVRISTTSAFDTGNPRGEDYKFRRRNIYTEDWTDEAGTVYAGSYEAVSGKLKARPQYASYNGEALVGPWLSSMDVYAAGTTPTTGAQVVDLGGAETEYTLTPQQVGVLSGENNIWADTGDVTVTVKGAGVA